MRPIFFTLLFLSSFAFGQEMTQQEEAEKMAEVMAEEMACSDVVLPTNAIVVDANSGTPLVGAKIVFTTYYSEVKEFTSDNNGKFDFGSLMLCDTVTVSMDGYISTTKISGDHFFYEQDPEWKIELSAANDGGDNSSQDEADPSTTTQTLTSLGLDSGYKGYAWGSAPSSAISTVFSLLPNGDSTNLNQSFSGMLGLDSVVVTYAYADSGFWKAEIDFVVNENNVQNLIEKFKRLERNISEVYGPPQAIKQKESGPSAAYSMILDQKFSTAFYRSKWSITPVFVELLLNATVLKPVTDLSIFSDNYTVLKLVYNNPDYMHSSKTQPEPEVLPSIFDIY